MSGAQQPQQHHEGVRVARVGEHAVDVDAEAVERGLARGFEHAWW
jgi:hypothetical protein